MYLSKGLKKFFDYTGRLVIPLGYNIFFLSLGLWILNTIRILSISNIISNQALLIIGLTIGFCVSMTPSGFLAKQTRPKFKKTIIWIFILSITSLFVLEVILDRHLNLHLGPNIESARSILGYVVFYTLSYLLIVLGRESKTRELIRPEPAGSPEIITTTASSQSLTRFFKKHTYSIVLFAICLLSLLIKVCLATKMMFHIDEAYTNLVTLGFFKYHTLRTTLSGAIYPRTPFYNLLNSASYLFISNPLLKLRLLNIILFTALQPVLYILVKKIFDRKVALLFTLLTSLSWYITTNIIAARSYNILVITSFISLLCLYLSLRSAKNKEQGRAFKYFLIASAMTVVTFFEGHSLGAYHIVPFFLIAIAYLCMNLAKKYRVILLATSMTALGIVACYFIFVAPTFFRYVATLTYGIQFRAEIIGLFGSLVSYYSIVGLSLLGSFLLASLYYRDRRILIFTIYALFILFFQGYFFGKVSIDIRHFSDTLLPIFLVISYTGIKVAKTRKLRPYLVLISLLFLLTSVRGLYGINQDEVSWAPYYPDTYSTDIALIPEDATIITDSPSVVYFFRPKAKIYMLYGAENYQIRNINLDTSDSLEQHSALEKNNFRQFIASEINPRYITAPNQEYFIYSGSPKIMSTEHLNSILRTNKSVYILLTHNALNSTTEGQQQGLYEYIFSKAAVIKNELTKNNYFDNRSYPYSYNSREIVGKLSI